MPDQSLTCTTCGQRFTWSTGEQQFYRERGLQAPRRCPDCRAAKRQQPATPAARTRDPSQQAARPIVSRRTPRRIFGLATLAAAGALSVTLFMLVPSGPLLAWLLAINLIAVLTYGYDKAIAGGTRMRVPEAVLLGLALFCTYALLDADSNETTELDQVVVVRVTALNGGSQDEAKPLRFRLRDPEDIQGFLVAVGRLAAEVLP